MTRLIDADELVPMMKYATTDSEIGVFPIKIGFKEITKVIDESPTVDAQPVRHGTWRHYERMLTCSECGTVFDDDIMEYFGEEVPKYCPECGAKMDAGETE